MEDIKRALENMGKDVSTTITALRTDMREQYQEVGKDVSDLRDVVDHLQRGLARQAHVLDQGLAETHDLLARHHENVGSIVLTYVEDLNAVKSDVRALAKRVDRLERPPAA